MKYKVVNSDGHTIEPPDMWLRYLPKKFHDRAPRVVKDPKGGDAWEFFPDVAPAAIGMVTTAGQKYEEMHWYGSTYETINRGCFEGDARVEEMMFDGVDAEVLYPSQRMMTYFTGSDDEEFHKAGVAAYNDWIYNEFSAADHRRLIPMYQMPNLGIETSLAELKQAKKSGYRGVILTHWPSGNPALGEADEGVLGRGGEPRNAGPHPHQHRRRETERERGRHRRGRGLRESEHHARRDAVRQLPPDDVGHHP